MRTEERDYQEYLQGKFLPGRTLYLEHMVYPRYLKELPAGATIVDLGCGNGEFLAFCRRKGIAASGIDSNPFFVEANVARGLQVQQDDITSLATLPEVGVAAALADNVLEHLDREQICAALRAVERVLAPGGVFLAVVPGEKGFAKDPTHRTFVSETVIAEAAAGTRMRLRRAFRWPFPPRFVSTFFYLNMTVFVLAKE